jgi:hypothetical protein
MIMWLRSRRKKAPLKPRQVMMNMSLTQENSLMLRKLMQMTQRIQLIRTLMKSLSYSAISRKTVK